MSLGWHSFLKTDQRDQLLGALSLLYNLVPVVVGLRSAPLADPPQSPGVFHHTLQEVHRPAGGKIILEPQEHNRVPGTMLPLFHNLLPSHKSQVHNFQGLGLIKASMMGRKYHGVHPGIVPAETLFVVGATLYITGYLSAPTSSTHRMSAACLIVTITLVSRHGQLSCPPEGQTWPYLPPDLLLC